MVLCTQYFVKDFAINNAEEIKNGYMDEYNVLVPDSQHGSVETNVALLGSSSRFTYFYNVKTTEAIVVPIENISYMKKVLLNDSKAKNND